MSKNVSLEKKLEVFEKLAKFGDRSDFLQAIAQDYVNVEDKLKAGAYNLYNVIQKWIATYGEKQVDVPGSPVGLPVAMRGPVQSLINILKSDKYDLDILPSFKNTLKSLMITDNLGNLNENLKESWRKSVFAQASYVADLVDSQERFLNAWSAKNAPLMNQEEKSNEAPASKPATPKAQPLNQKAKAISQALINKINKLPDGPERTAQLQQVEQGVKALQTYFKKLQNSPNMPDYLARVSIVDALNKVYNSLDYQDLKTVVSLAPGREGVPSDPNSKI